MPHKVDFNKLFDCLNLPKSEQTKLFLQALTHKSYLIDNEDSLDLEVGHYDRLEFWGDSVLKFVINQYLFKTFTKYNSGSLTKISAFLLSDKILLRIAHELNLKPFVRTGKKIPQEAVLADVMEAIFAASYFTFGLQITENLILRLYKDLVKEADADDLKDNYKAALQEFAQSKKLGLPVYELVQMSGPANKPEFILEISLAGQILGRGFGNSKKEAGQMAAKSSLKLLEDTKLFKEIHD